MSLNNTFKESGKTFRDVMVVVIGIAITFSLNNWISNKNERKDVQLYLEAVKIELEANLKDVENHTKYYQHAMELSEYLNSHKLEDYQLDSIEKHYWMMFSTYTFKCKTSAFEMLKISGAMRLLKDKTFLSNIWDMYAMLEFLKVTDQEYELRKGDEIFNLVFSGNLIKMSTQIDLLLNISRPEFSRYLSFLKMPFFRSRYNQFLLCGEQIRETLEAIDNQK
jgi:hypothetical protein